MRAQQHEVATSLHIAMSRGGFLDEAWLTAEFGSKRPFTPKSGLAVCNVASCSSRQLAGPGK